MDTWVVDNPIKLSITRISLPYAPGLRVVLFKNGVPKRVLADDGLEIRLSPIDAMRFDRTVGVRKFHSWFANFDSFLFSQDRVEIHATIKVFIRSHNSDRER